MKEQDKYEAPKSSAVMRFLWSAAGGDRYFLEKGTYSDQIKYMCLGGIVFATGAMAGLAGGYAFYTIFSPKSAEVLNKINILDNPNYIPTDIPTVIMSVIFGIVWGLMIFNIDRFIVTSTGKGDGTEKITWDEFKGAIPRIIMGAIIAITISKPIEIRMFKSEIDLAVQKEQEKEKEKGILQANKNYDLAVFSTDQKIKKIKDDIEEFTNAENTLRREVMEETNGANNNGANYGPRAENLERQANIQEDKKKDLLKSPEYISAKEDIKEFDTKRKEDITEAKKKAATLDGLLIRLQKANEIAGWEISLFITLLFMVIELTPIFFKLMLTKSPYDYLNENRDDLIKAEHGIEVRYDFYKDNKGQERHLVINHEFERVIYEKKKITEIQKELTDYAIEKYKIQEKEKIDSNLEDYIKKIDPNNINDEETTG